MSSEKSMTISVELNGVTYQGTLFTETSSTKTSNSDLPQSVLSNKKFDSTIKTDLVY